MEKNYEVTVANSFDADSPEDAVRQMIEWLLDHAPGTGYLVSEEGEDGYGPGVYIDASDLDLL